MECFTKIVNGFKQLTIFSKHSILDVWEGSEYGFLKLFCRGSKRDKQDHLIFIGQTGYSIHSDFSPYSKVIHGITIFKLTKG